MIRTCRTIKDNWRKNHRYHGGVRAVARCLIGTLSLRSGLVSPRRREPASVEILTFSVVPWMTVLWTRVLHSALGDRDTEILIGDCSGGLGRPRRGLLTAHRARVVTCLNDHHGDKLDLFLNLLCRAPYVVIADDDVFWLNDRPLAWALNQLEADPTVAAVSLLPRKVVSSVLERDKIEHPMGSHCLVIRRDLWRRERLSFAVAPSPVETDDWFYDTGDLANRELLQRGYRVVIAPPEVQDELVALDAVSAWVLKLQGLDVKQLESAVTGIPIRQKKAQQAIRVARGLPPLLVQAGLAAVAPEILPEPRLSAADRMLEAHMPAAQRSTANREVDQGLARLTECLGTADAETLDSPAYRPLEAME